MEIMGLRRITESEALAALDSTVPFLEAAVHTELVDRAGLSRALSLRIHRAEQ
jgi:hypothetical protein